MEAGKPGTQGMQGTHIGYCIIQGSLGQELQLPIYTAKEVVHGHRVRPAERARGRQSEPYKPQEWARGAPQPYTLDIWSSLTSQTHRAEVRPNWRRTIYVTSHIFAQWPSRPMELQMQAGTVCHLRLAPLPWPPRLQEGQQHLDPTDNDRLALFSLKHVTQELLNGLLPEGRGIKSKGPRARTPPGQVPP